MDLFLVSFGGDDLLKVKTAHRNGDALHLIVQTQNDLSLCFPFRLDKKFGTVFEIIVLVTVSHGGVVASFGYLVAKPDKSGRGGPSAKKVKT
jgi:hypothetical protein